MQRHTRFKKTLIVGLMMTLLGGVGLSNTASANKSFRGKSFNVELGVNYGHRGLGKSQLNKRFKNRGHGIYNNGYGKYGYSNRKFNKHGRAYGSKYAHGYKQAHGYKNSNRGYYDRSYYRYRYSEHKKQNFNHGVRAYGGYSGFKHRKYHDPYYSKHTEYHKDDRARHLKTVSFYGACSFKSQSVRLPVGEYKDTSYLASVTTDFGSLHVPAGIKIIAYKGKNFHGPRTVFESSIGCLSKPHNEHYGSFKIVSLTQVSDSNLERSRDEQIEYEQFGDQE